MFREYTEGQLRSRSKDEMTKQPTYEGLLKAALDMVEEKQQELVKWYNLYMSTLPKMGSQLNGKKD